ncbi:MAG: hypothetical protein ACI89X_003915 [Planctomycetota bacterium]
MSDAVAVPAVLPRTRARALQLTAMTLWLPCLLPIAFGTFRDCWAIYPPYLAMVPVVPGVFLGALLQSQDAWFFVVASVPTILLFVGLYFACRKLPPRFLHPLQWLVIAGVAVEAVLFGELICT